MEKGVDSFIEYVKEAFQLEDKDMKTYSPLTLAYIGDGIYDLIIRTIYVKHGNSSVQRLHLHVSKIVKAPAQAALIDKIMPMLTEEEQQVYKRGRNAKSYSKAKNASVMEYRKATGFEALLGYLYLTENTKRILELVKAGLDEGEKECSTKN